MVMGNLLFFRVGSQGRCQLLRMVKSRLAWRARGWSVTMIANGVVVFRERESLTRQGV